MICYKDKTFCPFYETCDKKNDCILPLTPAVKEAAVRWWGSDEAPIAVFSEKPQCHTDNKEKELSLPSVVHCKREKHDVYIGRPSKWGNPFEIGKDGDRETVIRKYREWVVTRPRLMAALPELRGKVLGCWCAPQACHGDVLVELANATSQNPADETITTDQHLK